MEFLNPWMLTGLAGLAIPVLVHLLSRRKLDVVDWGAMQFLEPSPRQRRSLWLENLWLMLLRMGMIALLAIALTRPWFQSVWLARLTTVRSQDVALIVDGSYSLDMMTGPQVAGDQVRRLARGVLDQLDVSDLVQIYDARESSRPQFPDFTRHSAAVREVLLDLPLPSGTSDLPAALNRAARDLLRTGNLDRDIVVVTDGQRFPWHVDDTAAWQTFDALMRQARVKPRVWVLTAAAGESVPFNLSLGPIRLSRELAMPGARIRVQAAIQSTGRDAPVNAEVDLEIDGVRSPAHVTTVRVPGNGTASVEFDLTLERAGCHALTLNLRHPADDLAPDNQATAVVEIGGGWPVLLVDGSPAAADETQSETWFAMAALDAGPDSWIKPARVSLADWDSSHVSDYAAVVLANVRELNGEQIADLEEWISGGGAVLVTLGDQTTAVPKDADGHEISAGTRWLPVRPVEVRGDPTVPDTATTITADSLQLPWQESFRQQRTGGFSDVRFRQWWRLQVPEAVQSPENSTPNPSRFPAAQVVARFASGDPALIWQRRGRGSVAVWASTLDADWNALASQPDYVAWWHEVLFALLEPASRRNVAVEEPLLVRAPAGSESLAGLFLGPRDFSSSGEVWNAGNRSGRRLPAPRWPGIYLFAPGLQATNRPAVELQRRLTTGAADLFAVQADVQESDLTPLSAADRQQLTTDRPLRFIASPDELESAWLGESGRTELSVFLLYALLFFLLLETWLTRRLVQRGTREVP